MSHYRLRERGRGLWRPRAVHMMTISQAESIFYVHVSCFPEALGTHEEGCSIVYLGHRGLINVFLQIASCNARALGSELQLQFSPPALGKETGIKNV